MPARRAAVLLLAAAGLAGCGAKTEPDLSKLAVTGTVDISPAPGQPEGGPVAATTTHAVFPFTGGVRPTTAHVTLTPPRGRAALVRPKLHGQFHGEARKLRRGANRFVLRGTAPGLRPWTLVVSITRK
jgi:hypothetical protein